MIPGAPNFDWWEFAPRSWSFSGRRAWRPVDLSVEVMVKHLARVLLQPARSKFGRIDITSGIRMMEDHHSLEAAGRHPSKDSDHFFGARPTNSNGGRDWSVGAVDIVPHAASPLSVWEWMRRTYSSELFGQLLLETETSSDENSVSWVHVSNPKSVIYARSLLPRIEPHLRVGVGENGIYQEAT